MGFWDLRAGKIVMVSAGIYGGSVGVDAYWYCWLSRYLRTVCRALCGRSVDGGGLSCEMRSCLDIAIAVACVHPFH